MAKIKGTEVQIILNSIHTHGDYIGHELVDLIGSQLNEFSQSWKSPDARDFFNACKDTFNQCVSTIISTLNEDALTIKQVAERSLLSEGSTSTLNYYTLGFKLVSCDPFQKGINDNDQDILFDPTFTNGLGKKIATLFEGFSARILNIKKDATEHPEAFEGAGQNELIASLTNLSSNVLSSMRDLNDQLNSYLSNRGETQSSVISSNQSSFGSN